MGPGSNAIFFQFAAFDKAQPSRKALPSRIQPHFFAVKERSNLRNIGNVGFVFAPIDSSDPRLDFRLDFASKRSIAWRQEATLRFWL
jgi:hypothetical protein